MEASKHIIRNLIYDTNPIIFHAQGKIQYCPLWENIKACCFEYKAVPYDVQIVTFNNNQSFPGKESGCLERSVCNQCHVMGNNVLKWRNCLKIPLTIKFLELAKSKYVLSADSSDVVVYSFNNIVDLFLSRNCDILFNAEVNCWPKDNRAEEGKFLKPFCYLNAGVWIGYREAALEFFRECLSDFKSAESDSEQFYIKRNYLDYNVIIDDRCEIFQTLNRVNANQLEIK